MKEQPKLQLAIDDYTALLNVSSKLIEYVDVVEAGTMTIYYGGLEGVKLLKKKFPNKKILADIKMVDAGNIVVPMFMDAGADMITVLSTASINIIEVAQREASKRNKDIQIELYGSWDWDMANQWLDKGITKVSYRRNYDTGAKGWSKEDLSKIESLCEKGFKVSAAGGITLENITELKAYPIDTFVVGRTILNGINPLDIVKKFRAAL